LLKLRIKDAEGDGSLKNAVSVYDYESNVVRDGIMNTGKKVITFSNVLNHEVFPLADILQTLLNIGQKEMNLPIEIEFAANLNVPEGSPKVFSFLQIRPIVDNDQSRTYKLSEIKSEKNCSVVKIGHGKWGHSGFARFYIYQTRIFQCSEK
jgi:hypothetical protein